MTRITCRTLTLAAASIVVLAVAAACDRSPQAKGGREVSVATSGTGGTLNGAIAVDGSSTVLPISKAIGEAFQAAHPGVRVEVSASGTGGGFKRFCGGQLDVAGASRPINATETKECQSNQVEFIELP